MAPTTAAPGGIVPGGTPPAGPGVAGGAATGSGGPPNDPPPGGAEDAAEGRSAPGDEADRRGVREAGGADDFRAVAPPVMSFAQGRRR
jgi:hypothetical protein